MDWLIGWTEQFSRCVYVCSCWAVCKMRWTTSHSVWRHWRLSWGNTSQSPICWSATFSTISTTHWQVFFALLSSRSEVEKVSRKWRKGSPYSITEPRVPELIPVLGSQPAGDVSHKPGGRLPLLFARPAVTPATLKRADTSFAAWWTEARWVWTVCLRLFPDSLAAAIWTRALLHLSPAC